jgi:3-methyladenine DNA glycosylase AlkC
MTEPLKELYNGNLINLLSDELKHIHKNFKADAFKTSIFDEEWDNRALKERMRHIAKTLRHYLPSDYKKALFILKPVSAKFRGFEYMFFPDFVALFGLDDYETSINALEYFTPFSSAEFAVRPFIKKYKHKMMRQMEKWAESDNYHVRRLASEGCRPRIPWAMALPDFKKNPAPVLNVIRKLKQDENEYVRRSVANNLNDISKDNPQIVLKIAKEWLGDSPKTDWIIKHACRSLLKKGVPEALQLFGFNAPNHVKIDSLSVPSSVVIGGELAFAFSLHTTNGQLGQLRIEYAIDFVKLNGKLSKKVFKISEAVYSEQTKKVLKRHSFKKISTRKYYPGIHGLSVIVNGKQMDECHFILNK